MLDEQCDVSELEIKGKIKNGLINFPYQEGVWVAGERLITYYTIELVRSLVRAPLCVAQHTER